MENKYLAFILRKMFLFKSAKEIYFNVRYIITGIREKILDKGMCGKDAEKYRTKTNLINFIISIESYRYNP